MSFLWQKVRPVRRAFAKPSSVLVPIDRTDSAVVNGGAVIGGVASYLYSRSVLGAFLGGIAGGAVGIAVEYARGKNVLGNVYRLSDGTLAVDSFPAVDDGDDQIRRIR